MTALVPSSGRPATEISADRVVVRTLRQSDELIAQLVFQLTNVLSPRGFVLQTQGPAGLVFRKPIRPPFYLGIGLFLIGLATLIDGEPLGAPFLLGGAALMALHLPKTIVIGVERLESVSCVSGPARERGVREAIERAT